MVETIASNDEIVSNEKKGEVTVNQSKIICSFLVVKCLQNHKIPRKIRFK